MKRTLLFGIAILSSLTLFAQVKLDSGLVGCYPFSGDAKDYSGNSNNGTVVNATLTTDRWGQANNAYLFNGTTTYIGIANFPAMIPKNEISISIWSEANAYTSNCAVLLMPDSEHDRLGCCINYTGGPYAIWDFGDLTGVGRMITTTGTYTTVWEHYVFMISQSGNIKKIFKNGVVIDSSAYEPGLVGRAGRTLQIGGGTDWSGPSLKWNGALDDVRIYNRALTDDEVLALYNLPKTTGCSTVGISTIEEALAKTYKNDQGQINISTGKTGINGSIQLYNVLGQKVLSKNLTMIPYSSAILNVSMLPKGIYMLTILSGENNYTWKFEQ